MPVDKTMSGGGIDASPSRMAADHAKIAKLRVTTNRVCRNVFYIARHLQMRQFDDEVYTMFTRIRIFLAIKPFCNRSKKTGVSSLW